MANKALDWSGSYRKVLDRMFSRDEVESGLLKISIQETRKGKSTKQKVAVLKWSSVIEPIEQKIETRFFINFKRFRWLSKGFQRALPLEESSSNTRIQFKQ